jgi:Mg2+/Co2+ transporter CorC
VTVEDVLEEVVGEIEDETDPAADSLRRLTDGDWYVRGHVSLGDLEDAGIELPVETDAYNSVGGYVFSELGRLPKRGDTVRADGYTIRVESVRENRIVAVRISAPAAAWAPVHPNIRAACVETDVFGARRADPFRPRTSLACRQPGGQEAGRVGRAAHR